VALSQEWAALSVPAAECGLVTAGQYPLPDSDEDNTASAAAGDRTRVQAQTRRCKQWSREDDHGDFAARVFGSGSPLLLPGSTSTSHLVDDMYLPSALCVGQMWSPASLTPQGLYYFCFSFSCLSYQTFFSFKIYHPHYC
jgi:hypothetical protein